MDTANELIEKLCSWLKQRKDFAEQLRKMARELESLHEKLKATQCVGSSVSVIGAASLLGAGVLTLCTGGAAAPVLATVGAVYGGVGLTISLSAKVAEAWSSSSTLKDAKKIMEDNEKLGQEIKKLVEQLMRRCMEEADAASCSEDADRCAAGYIGRAIAGQRGLRWSTGLGNWFQNSSRFGRHHFQTSSTGHSGILSAIGIGYLTLGLWEILKNKSLQKKLFGTGGKVLLLTLKESADEMTSAGMNAASNLFKDAAVKTMAKGLAQAGGGALGLAFSLPEAIDNWKDMIENNHVSEASQSMKDAAKQLERANSDLRKELDDIGAMLTEIERMSRYIKSMTYTLNINEEGLFVVNFIKRNTNNDQINNWLNELSHSAQFLNLLGYFYQELRKSSFPQGQDLDIVFCGHGAIRPEHRHPAIFLMPLPIIKDVILYSPWNCAIDASVVYGIATGLINLNDRDFVPSQNRPSSLPWRWNSMRHAGIQSIPEIMLKPVGQGESAWEALLAYSCSIAHNRIFFPYLMPVGADPTYFPEAPFYVVLLALSVVLSLFVGSRATVHFAGCLSREAVSRFTRDDYQHLSSQYACTADGTYMRNSVAPPTTPLYRAIQFLFPEERFCRIS